MTSGVDWLIHHHLKCIQFEIRSIYFQSSSLCSTLISNVKNIFLKNDGVIDKNCGPSLMVPWASFLLARARDLRQVYCSPAKAAGNVVAILTGDPLWLQAH